MLRKSMIYFQVAISEGFRKIRLSENSISTQCHWQPFCYAWCVGDKLKLMKWCVPNIGIFSTYFYTIQWLVEHWLFILQYSKCFALCGNVKSMFGRIIHWVLGNVFLFLILGVWGNMAAIRLKPLFQTEGTPFHQLVKEPLFTRLCSFCSAPGELCLVSGCCLTLSLNLTPQKYIRWLLCNCLYLITVSTASIHLNDID